MGYGGIGDGRSLVAKSKIVHLLMAVRREIADSTRSGDELRTSDLVAVQILEELGTRYDTIQDFLVDLAKK